MSITQPKLNFKCVECDERFQFQIDFYNHLKVHYEPVSSNEFDDIDDHSKYEIDDENHSKEIEEVIPKLKRKIKPRSKTRLVKTLSNIPETLTKEPSTSENTTKVKTRSGRVSRPRARDNDMVRYF